MTYSITPTGPTGCAGTPLDVVVTVEPVPTVNNPGNQALCDGALTTDVNFTGTATSYTWVNDTPSIGIGSNGTGDIAAFTAVNTGTVPVIATITVTPNSAGCSGTPQVFTITVNPTPVVNNPGNQALCDGALTNTGKLYRYGCIVRLDK